MTLSSKILLRNNKNGRVTWTNNHLQKSTTTNVNFKKNRIQSRKLEASIWGKWISDHSMVNDIGGCLVRMRSRLHRRPFLICGHNEVEGYGADGWKMYLSMLTSVLAATYWDALAVVVEEVLVCWWRNVSPLAQRTRVFHRARRAAHSFWPPFYFPSSSSSSSSLAFYFFVVFFFDSSRYSSEQCTQQKKCVELSRNAPTRSRWW